MTTDSILVIHQARGWWQRLGGLLTRPALRAHEALYLAPCNSVHTGFMRYPIDVAFVDRHGTVLKLVCHLKPWRAAWCWRAHGAVEFAAGRAAANGIQPGSTVPLSVHHHGSNS